MAILLCTYNGQQYLNTQMDSIAAQKFSHWRIWASDDGSQDDTLTILAEYRAKWPENRLTIARGPQNGFVANFLSLACNVNIQASYYAFCDQDDIWDADKLDRALAWLETMPEHVPALYCSRTRLVDDDERETGFSPLYVRTPCFANALTQNVGSGNTMVFNAAARKLLLEAGETVDVVAHDWWTYMLVSGCGGKVFCDPSPAISYRQHDANVVGVDLSWRALVVQIRKILGGYYKRGNSQHIAALRALQHRLTPENLAMLETFANARSRWLIPRLYGLLRSGVYRQQLSGNISLFAAAILNKV